MAYNFNQSLYNAWQNMPMTWGPGGAGNQNRNDAVVDQYMRGDARRYYNFKMPSSLSPSLQGAYQGAFSDVYGEYENQINKQAGQSGQLPRQNFTDWLDKFSFENWYAGKTPINNRYNFASGLRWY